MNFGTVTSFDLTTGSGRIRPDRTAEDITICRSAVEAAGLGQLAVDQRLGFDIISGARGPKAVRLWATWSNR